MTLRFLAAALLLAAPAAAAELPPELLGCAAIARDADRLACYDRTISGVSAEARALTERRAAETARLVAAEKAAAEAETARLAAERARRKKEDFGAETVASRAAEVRAERASEEMQSVDAAVTEVLTNRSGLGVFLLDNGQMWRQLDTQSLPNIRAGDKARVERTAMGGYNIVFDRLKRRLLVKRIR